MSTRFQYAKQIPKFPRKHKKRQTARRKDQISNSVVPNSRIVKMRFAVNEGLIRSMESAAGGLVSYTYKANSPYDPHEGAGTHQAYGFDQWMTFFRKGVVLGSKIVGHFVHANNDDANRPMWVGISISRDDTAITSKAQIQEDPRSRMKVLAADGNKVTVAQYYSAKKMSGVKNPSDEDDLKFGENGDPAKLYYYHVCAYGMAAQTETAYFTGHITFLCRLMEPQMLTPS